MLTLAAERPEGEGKRRGGSVFMSLSRGGHLTPVEVINEELSVRSESATSRSTSLSLTQKRLMATVGECKSNGTVEIL